MPLVGKSLNAATSVGPGIAIIPDTPKTKASLQLSYTGSPTEAEVSVEYTIDRANWKSLAVFAASSDPSGKLVTVGDLGPFTAMRANLTSLTGGSSPTVTVWIALA